jgi:hypothetical protein
MITGSGLGLQIGGGGGGGGGEGEGSPLDSLDAGNLHHVEADHGVVVHNDAVVGLDKAHTPHVCRQVEDVLAPLHYFLAIVVHTQVHQVEFVTEQIFLYSPSPVRSGKLEITPSSCFLTFSSVKCACRSLVVVRHSVLVIQSSLGVVWKREPTGMCSFFFQSQAMM